MLTKPGVVEYYLSNGLLFAFLQKNIILDLQTVTVMIQKRNELNLTQTMPLIIVTNGKHHMDIEARQLMASPSFTKAFTSIAVFCNNTFVKYVFSFFSKTQKPNVAIQIFNNKTDAEKWSLHQNH